MLNKTQLASLNQELDLNRIKTREKGNISLSYIEGFDVIDTANLIFGYGNWSYLISSLTQVSQEQNHNQNVVVCYKAVVKLIVKDENHSKSTSRQDVGFGTGTAKTLADSHENAGKEAVTDALKRAMRSFGNQFGNIMIRVEIIRIVIHHISKKQTIIIQHSKTIHNSNNLIKMIMEIIDL